jgi:hypothetical protein
LTHRRAIAAAAIACALATASTGASAQSDDWDRAEEEAIGDHTEDATQAEVLLGPPEESQGDGERDGDRNRDRNRDGDDDGRGDGDGLGGGDDDGDGDGDEDDTGLFGSTDRGGAIRFFGDVGTFFGAVSVLGGAGPVGQTDAFSLTPWLGISYGVTDKLVLGVEWGFSLLAHNEVRLITGTSDDGGVALTAGNPTIFGRWIPSGIEGDFAWGVDLSVGFPVASANTPAEGVAINSAIGSRGAWDLFHWLDGAFSIVPGLFIDWEPLERFVLHAEVDLGLLFGVGTANYSTVGVLQLQIDASYRLVEAFAIGLRVMGVLMGEEASPTRDTFQLAMAPYLAFFADPLFIRGEFLLNITEPYGTSFTDQKWWGARLVVGVDID